MSASSDRYKQVLTSSNHTYNYYSSAAPKSNTTILFVHGFPYTSKIWRHAISHFEKLGYGCIAPDILGHGKTSKPNNPAEYARPVASKSMIEILDAEGVDRAVIIGHDWGSSIASSTAVAYPSRILALVMVCVPYFKPGKFDLKAINDMTEQAFGLSCFGYWEVFLHEPELLTQHIESFYEGFYAKDTASWEKHFTPRGKLREWLTSDGRCEVKSSIDDIDRQDFLANDWEAALQYYHCFTEGFNEEAEKDIPEDQTDVLVPALMVAATSDGCSPLPMVESMQGGLKDGKLVVIEGDHHIFLDHKERFNSELVTFFGEKGIKPKK